jgi:DNA transposition AAA+ family ATPase
MSGEEHDNAAAPDEREQQEQREAMDRLNERNRVLMEARMLPPHSQLGDDQIAMIVEAFKAYIAENKITAAQVAREIQYVTAVLSTWMRGTYKGDVSAVTRAVNNWMERDARRRQSRRPKDYVTTWVAEDIRTYCYMADKNGRMAVIVAPSGTGKTKVLKLLTEEMRGLYVCCSESMTLRGLYLALARELGWTREGGHRHELERYIVERLTGTKRIIFIDEAHQLGAAIRSLRSIHDVAEVPIVMVGTDEIEQATNDRAHGRGQFSSRCKFYNALDHVHASGGGTGGEEGKDLFTTEAIREFFAKRKIRLDRDGFKMMWALSCLPGHGCLRLLEQIVEVVFMFNPEAELLTRDDVLSALRMVERSAFVMLQRKMEQQMERWEELAAVG